MNRYEAVNLLHTKAMDEINDVLIQLQDETLDVGQVPRRFTAWHAGDGSGLWWNVADTGGVMQEEPSYVGKPSHANWPWCDGDQPFLLWVPLPKLARNQP